MQQLAMMSYSRYFCKCIAFYGFALIEPTSYKIDKSYTGIGFLLRSRKYNTEFLKFLLKTGKQIVTVLHLST